MPSEIYLPSIADDLHRIGVPYEGIWGEVSSVSSKFIEVDEKLKKILEGERFTRKERFGESDLRLTLYDNGNEAIIIQRDTLNPDGTWAGHRLSGYGPKKDIVPAFDSIEKFYRECSFTVERT